MFRRDDKQQTKKKVSCLSSSVTGTVSTSITVAYPPESSRQYLSIDENIAQE